MKTEDILHSSNPRLGACANWNKPKKQAGKEVNDFSVFLRSYVIGRNRRM